jgi:glucose-6-phosphate 1-dehydrogenase
VSIQFRPTPHLMFPTGRENAECHLPTFRLQPHEGILQRFVAKEPRPSLTLRPVTMNFACADAFGIEKPPRPCAWLLLEVMEGDQRLFARADWIYEAWSIVDRLVRHWEDRQPRDFPNCAAETSGPADGDRLLARDGRAWRAV